LPFLGIICVYQLFVIRYCGVLYTLLYKEYHAKILEEWVMGKQMKNPFTFCSFTVCQLLFAVYQLFVIRYCGVLYTLLYKQSHAKILEEWVMGKQMKNG
jgi:hypothetical protein